MSTLEYAVQDLASHAEIAVACASPTGSYTSLGGVAGSQEREELLDCAIKLYKISASDKLQISLDLYTIKVVGDDRHVLAVMYNNGTAVAKSLTRMMRRTLRRLQPPAPPAQSAHVI